MNFFLKTISPAVVVFLSLTQLTAQGAHIFNQSSNDIGVAIKEGCLLYVTAICENRGERQEYIRMWVTIKKKSTGTIVYKVKTNGEPQKDASLVFVEAGEVKKAWFKITDFCDSLVIDSKTFWDLYSVAVE